MRIISQDGTIDVPYENYSVNSKEAKIFVRNAGDNWGVLFAEYSTPEKAEKAMGMLRKAYMFHNEFRICKDTPSKLKVGYVDAMYGAFQFPKDEDIEI